MTVDLAARGATSVRHDLGAALELLRPRQWIKNIAVVLVPLAQFAPLDRSDSRALFAALVAMCCASSLVYVVNDLLDRERDRAHPTKRTRPLASGRVSPQAALALIATLATASFLTAALARPAVAACVGAYVAVNLAYCLRLKHVALLDIACISTGFVLRALAGAFAVAVTPSPWLLVAVVSGSFALVVGKRRSELASHPEAARTRPALHGYTVPVLDHMVIACSGAAIGAYLAFLVPSSAPGTRSGVVAASALLALVALLRFLQFVMTERDGAENPTRFLTSDPMMLSVAATWIVMTGVAGVLGRVAG